MFKYISFLSLVFFTHFLCAGETLISDFEGESYVPWKVEGEAFGKGPAHGTLPNQMEVTGFEGNGLVNSYTGGDNSTGKLISPVFTIDRPYLSLLIGGGAFPDTLYITLIIDGKEIVHQTGWNSLPGGSEKLQPIWYHLDSYLGQKAHIEIVDLAKGGWGHINVDSIKLTDEKPIGQEILPSAFVSRRREIKTDKPFLLIPVAKNGIKTTLQIGVQGGPTSALRIPFPQAGEAPFFYGTLSTAPWKGKTISISTDRISESSDALSRILESDEIADIDEDYNEVYRPQFHFSPRRGWTNDPNGLFYYKGTWHLFYQHNPFSIGWGNMTWGHAVSSDLFHWNETGDVLSPNEFGSVFSGSAVVDETNSSGLAPEGNTDPPILLFHTSYGVEAIPSQNVTQSMAYSLDGGKSWKNYEKNPILPHIIGGNRDPKVFRYEPTNEWIMALFLDNEDYALLKSSNLLDWKETCRIEKIGCSECPDMFELPVDGNRENMKWVFWGGNGDYLIGSFDGATFTKEAGPFHSSNGKNDYAAQSYFGLSNHRRVQLAWASGGSYPDMKFNQQFSIPRELSLVTTPDGIRLVFEPACELESLRSEKIIDITADEAEYQSYSTDEIPELFDTEITLDTSNAGKIQIKFGSPEQVIEYDPATNKMNDHIKFYPVDGKVSFRLVVDRTSWEIFAERTTALKQDLSLNEDDAICHQTNIFVPDNSFLSPRSLTIESEEGTFSIDSMKLWKIEKSMGN